MVNESRPDVEGLGVEDRLLTKSDFCDDCVTSIRNNNVQISQQTKLSTLNNLQVRTRLFE